MGNKGVSDVFAAFLAGKRKTIGNYSTDGHTLCMFGKAIARRVTDASVVGKPGDILVTDAGWCTVSTQRALKVCGLDASRKGGAWTVDGEKWDGGWRLIRRD